MNPLLRPVWEPPADLLEQMDRVQRELVIWGRARVTRPDGSVMEFVCVDTAPSPTR